MSPPHGGCGDIIAFGLDPIGVHFYVSEHYILNKLMYFDQTCIYTLLGGGGELIRFW